MQSPPNHNQQSGIDVSLLPKSKCPCGHDYFNQVYEIRRLSSIDPQNTTGKTVFVPMMIYICDSCGRPFDEGSKSPLKKV